MGLCDTAGHKWAITGVYDKGRMCVPCLRSDCEGYMRQMCDGKWMYVPRGFGNLGLDIEDDPTGGVSKIVSWEITHAYTLQNIPVRAGDVMVDIGAHVGVVSTWAALQWPGVKVYAYEPLRVNYERLQRNVKANNAQGITAYNLAVSGDGKPVTIVGGTNENSGGASCHYISDNGEPKQDIESITLAQIFEEHVPDRCRVLKIDCEGAEYDILEAGEKYLDKVDYFVGEFHRNERLKRRDYKELGRLVLRHIPQERVRVTIS